MDKLFNRFQSTLTAEIKALERTKTLIRKRGVNYALEYLLDAHNNGHTIFTTGVGKCVPIAQKLTATLISFGFKSAFIDPVAAFHGDSGKITRQNNGDVFIVFSKSGNTIELVAFYKIIPEYRRILITENINGKLARLGPDDLLYPGTEAILEIIIPDEGDGFNLAPMASTTVMLAVADGLCAALIEATGKTKKDFAKNHPGGSLGKRLLCTVGDLMETDPEYLPTIEFEKGATELSFFDLIMAFSTSRYGAVFILEDEKLWGIFTDGDLRRQIKKRHTNLMPIERKEFTHSPRTTTKETLATDALNLMGQESRVTVLPVVDDQNYLVGAIHVHDLIKAGTM